MFSKKVFVCFIAVCSAVLAERPNHYNYRFARSDSLKSASHNSPYDSDYESDFPSHEYAAEESANFGTYDIGGPGAFVGGGISDGIGYGGLNQFSNVGYSSGGPGFGFGSSGYNGGYMNQPQFYSSGGYVQRPFVTGGFGGHLGGHSQGGGYSEGNQYESAKKNAGDENFQEVQSKAGGSANQGTQGYNQGEAGQSSAKGDSGFYKDETANKQEAGDGKSYQGAQNFDKSGTEGNVENAAKSHKKGHITKGFKTSSSKNEEEKSETFYDEAHDEAARKNFDEKKGSFGEKSAAEFKGGHENESKDIKAQGKEGHFDSQQKLEDSNANKGEFGQTAFKGESEQFVKKNGLGAQSILGHQESSGQYLQKKPYGILPIHGDKK